MSSLASCQSAWPDAPLPVCYIVNERTRANTLLNLEVERTVCNRLLIRNQSSRSRGLSLLAYTFCESNVINHSKRRIFVDVMHPSCHDYGPERIGRGQCKQLPASASKRPSIKRTNNSFCPARRPLLPLASHILFFFSAFKTSSDAFDTRRPIASPRWNSMRNSFHSPSAGLA